MSYSFYKILHLIGIMALFLSLGGAIVRGLAGSEDKASRKLISITNGIALLFILVAGFGLMARLELSFEGWLVVKLILWIVFGGLLAVVSRKPRTGKAVWILILVLGITAAWLGVSKPAF